MTQESEGPMTAGSARDPGADTIELELTSEQQLALSRAAEREPAIARSEEACPAPSVPEYEHFPSRRTARVDLVCNVTFAVAVLGIAVAFGWPASDRHPPARAVITATPPVAELAQAGPPKPQGEPLRIKNAFDATEVFEFPAGTDETEARDAVAALLLSRARERRAEGLALGRTGTPQLSGGATVQRREVIVTRLLIGAKDPWAATN